MGFLFTFNSGMTIYHPQGDVQSVAVAVFSYLDLILLIVCLGSYEREAARSSTRQRLKAAVWILTTLLVAAFCYRVTAMVWMPLPMAALVWAMAFVTITGSIYHALLAHPESSSTTSGPQNLGESLL